MMVLAALCVRLFARASADVREDFFWRALDLPAFENPASMSSEVAFADFLFEAGLYSDAADEYDRVASLFPMDPVSDYASYQRALCLMRLRRFDEAAELLDRLGYRALDKEVSYRARLLRALLEVVLGGPRQGAFILSDLLRNTPEQSVEVLYWRGWLKLLDHDFSAARSDFAKVCESDVRNPYYSPRAYGILRWLDMHAKKLEQRSPYLARWLSGLVPGAGLAYAGNIPAALNSLALNGALGYLTLSELLAQRYIQATTLFLFLWNRYYFGGMVNSGAAAEMFNASRKDEVLSVLMDAFLGEGGAEGGSCEDEAPPKQRWYNGASVAARWMLATYGKYITTQDAQRCQFNPSCSRFATIAFETRNPVAALLMTSDRLQRCNPFAHLYYPRDEEGFLRDTLWGP